MRLILVRHGEPDYKNDSLTENGRIQAERTAQRLKKENIKKVYSSPLGRACETAQYTAGEQGLSVDVLDFMKEIDWGDINKDVSKEKALPDDGHPWSLGFKLLTENTEFVGGFNWDEHHYFKDNICLDYYRDLSDKIDGFLSGYGLVRKDGLYFCDRSCKDTVALFAHGGSGAVFLSHVLSLPFPFVLTSMPLGLCSVTIIEFWHDEGEMVVPRIELFNDFGHVSDMDEDSRTFEK